MSPPEWGIIGICLLLLAIFLKFPIGFSMLLLGFVGMWVLRGATPAFSVIATEPFRTASGYSFSVIPFFVLMGYLASYTGLSKDAFFTLNKWIGQLRGGLAMGTVGACTLFSAISGDPISIAGTMSVVTLPETRRYGYSDRLSLGTLAASGNLGFLIPPSLGLILYGLMTEQSIGVLFMGGVMPGLLLAFLFIISIWVRCRMNPQMAPPVPAASWTERISALPQIIPMLIIIVLVLGGIYGGIFTPTEAGAVGTFGILVLALAYRRLTWRSFTASLGEAARVTGMVFILVIGAMTFSRFIATAQLHTYLTNFITGLEIAPILILIGIMVIFILLGLILDIMAIILIIVPVLHPIMVGLGFDPVHFTILVITNVLIGAISPPVGIVVFALYGIQKGEVPLFSIYRGVLPFLAVYFAGLAILVAFPQISTWLPNVMRPG